MNSLYLLPTTLHSHEVLGHNSGLFCSVKNQLIPHTATLYPSFGEAEERSHCPEHLSNVQPALCTLISFPLNSAVPFCPTLNSTLPFSRPNSCHHSTEVCRIPPVSVLPKSIPTVLLFIVLYWETQLFLQQSNFFLHFSSPH